MDIAIGQSRFTREKGQHKIGSNKCNNLFSSPGSIELGCVLTFIKGFITTLDEAQGKGPI